MNRWLYILLLLSLTSCGWTEQMSDGQDNRVSADDLSADTLLELTQKQADSLEFRLLHHYTNNYNFVVKADSLVLIPREDELTDTSCVRRNDRIAVADIRESDTIWIKVARDQFTMGWIPEDQLLQGVVPDDPISQVINALTTSRYIWMTVVVVLGLLGFVVKRRGLRKLQIFRFDEMDSFYPTLFLILVSLVACLYVSIQHFTPEFWQEYYFHPTLNPLILPPVMAILLTLVWAVLGSAMISYLVIKWTTSIYVGYVLLAVYIVVLLYIYYKYIRCKYVCGSCGMRIKTKGVCPHCGKLNI